MLGKYIYNIRKKRGYTLSELADRVGISKSYLSTIERELKKNPSIQVMEKIAAALNVDISELLQKGKDPVKAQYLEKEWVDFINDFKNTGIDKEQIQKYKILVEFMKWYNDRLSDVKNSEAKKG